MPSPRLHRRRLGATGYRLRCGAAQVGPRRRRSACQSRWRELLAKPAFFVVYAAGLGANIIFTRAYATHAGPGMAAALDYCMRGVGVPLAILVNPISNSLLPEIAAPHLARRAAADRSDHRVRRGRGHRRLAPSRCSSASPRFNCFSSAAISRAESTRMVSAVFLGLGPSLIGWSLIEITARSLFALNRPWLPVIAIPIPVLVNVIVTLSLRPPRPEWLGAGSSVGLLAGFSNALRRDARSPQKLVGLNLAPPSGSASAHWRRGRSRCSPMPTPSVSTRSTSGCHAQYRMADSARISARLITDSTSTHSTSA